MSQSIIVCELQIGRVHGNEEGKLVRIIATSKVAGGRKRLAKIEVNLDDFARALMGGELVRASWIEGGQ